MKRVCVNPREYKPGEYLVVLDDLDRQIKYKPGGNMVNKTTHISRRLKDKDLVLVVKQED